MDESTDEVLEVDDGEAAPEGWYPEPGSPGRERYWDGEEWGGVRRIRPTGKANRLAVTALICACVGPFFVGGVLATVFGSVALDEIHEADGAERGQGMARWAIWLGFLNLILSGLVVIAVVALVER